MQTTSLATDYFRLVGLETGLYTRFKFGGVLGWKAIGLEGGQCLIENPRNDHYMTTVGK